MRLYIPNTARLCQPCLTRPSTCVPFLQLPKQQFSFMYLLTSLSTSAKYFLSTRCPDFSRCSLVVRSISQKFQEQIIPLHQQASAHMLPENAAILIRCKKMLVEPLQNRRRHVHYLPSLPSDLVYPSFGTSFHMILRIALVLQRRTTPYKNARCSELTN